MSRKGKVRKVATGDYLDPQWRDWLQTNRVELNAMDSPMFLDWLDGKMAGHGGKVLPPQSVLDLRFKADLAAIVRSQETARVLSEANIDGLVDGRLESLKVRVRNESRKLRPLLDNRLTASPELAWWMPVHERAKNLAEKEF